MQNFIPGYDNYRKAKRNVNVKSLKYTKSIGIIYSFKLTGK